MVCLGGGGGGGGDLLIAESRKYNFAMLCHEFSVLNPTVTVEFISQIRCCGP